MTSFNLADIHNFVLMTPRIATSGQPAREHFHGIAQAGYGAVINLAMPDSERALRDEGALVADQGMHYFHIPVPFAAPLPEHVRIFCDLLGGLETTTDRKIWVHCIMNYRVSAFVYHYLSKVRSVSEAAARSPVFERWQPDPVWSELLRWDRETLGL